MFLPLSSECCPLGFLFSLVTVQAPFSVKCSFLTAGFSDLHPSAVVSVVQWWLSRPPVLLLTFVCTCLVFQLDCELLKGRAMTYTSLYPQCLAYSKHSIKTSIMMTCCSDVLFLKDSAYHCFRVAAAYVTPWCSRLTAPNTSVQRSPYHIWWVPWAVQLAHYWD